MGAGGGHAGRRLAVWVCWWPPTVARQEWLGDEGVPAGAADEDDGSPMKTRMKSALPLRVLAGIFLLSAGIFVGASLGGVRVHDPQPVPQYPLAPTVGNPCGIAGAYVAAYLLYMHGLAALLAPLLLAAAGVYIVKTRDALWRAAGRFAGGFVALAALSYLLGIVLADRLRGPLAWLMPFGPGGVWGLVPVRLAVAYLGIVGGVFAGFLAFVSGCFLLSPTLTGWCLARLGALSIRVCRLAAGSLYLAGRLLGRLRGRPVATAALAAAAPVQMAEDAAVAEVASDANDEEAAGETVEFTPKTRRSHPTRPLPPPSEEAETASKPPVVEYRLPPMLLLENEPHQEADSQELLLQRGEVIVATLAQYDVPASLVAYHQGPAVTLFEVQLEEGIRLSRIESLPGDLAMRLRAPTQRLRIMAPVPGRGTVGIEVPNQRDRMVHLKPLLEAPEFRLYRDRSALTLALGKDVLAKPVITDLARLPHLLIAGTTGSGKSVCVNSIIVSLLMQKTPAELRFILIDPKQVEMSHYRRLPHLLTPVVTDIKRAVKALQWATIEMDRRYDHFHATGTRNIADYNRVPFAERLRRAGLPGNSPELPRIIPYILIVVDEFADLILQSRRDVEAHVQRLAQKARAAGLHLVFATQRPSADVFKGVIKANFPAVIAFQVSSAVNSRVVLDEIGAEALLGKGDLLFRSPDVRKPIRAKGAFLSDEEIGRVVAFWTEQAAPEYCQEIEEVMAEEDEEAARAGGLPLGAMDERFGEAVEFVIRTGRASASSLQAGLGIGYAKANKIIMAMEELQIVGEQRGVKFREVLITGNEWAQKREQLFANASRPPAIEPGAAAPLEEPATALSTQDDEEEEADEAGAADAADDETADETEEDDGEDADEAAEAEEDLEEDTGDEDAMRKPLPVTGDDDDIGDKPGGTVKSAAWRKRRQPAKPAGIVRPERDTAEFDFPGIPGS